MRLGRTQLRALTLIAAVAAGALAAPSLVGLNADPAPDRTIEHTGDLAGARYRTLPDPVRSLDDERTARAVALRDARVGRVTAGQRSAIVLVRPYGPFRPGEVPPADPCATVACYDVTIYLYGEDRVLEVFVDAARERVLRIRRTTGKPPLSAAEGRLAHRLAERDGEVAGLVAGSPHTHPGLAKPMWPGGVCDRHRCTTVIFYLGDTARTGIGRQLNVLVDLSARAILERTPITCDPACRIGWDT